MTITVKDGDDNYGACLRLHNWRGTAVHAIKKLKVIFTEFTEAINIDDTDGVSISTRLRHITPTL